MKYLYGNIHISTSALAAIEALGLTIKHGAITCIYGPKQKKLIEDIYNGISKVHKKKTQVISDTIHFGRLTHNKYILKDQHILKLLRQCGVKG